MGDGRGGTGGIGATGSGNAGGGGGGGYSNAAATRGSDASGITVGAGGGGDNAGNNGSAHSGAAGGAGGHGGSATFTSTDSSAEFVSVSGGSGGRGGQGGLSVGADGGNGGDGAAASLTTNSILVSRKVYVSGGEGGDGAISSKGVGISGQSGTGGTASYVTQGLTSEHVVIQSGGNGLSDGYGTEKMGAGGSASFIVTNTLSTPYVLLLARDSNLAVNIGRLNITSHDTTLDLEKTVAGTSTTAAGSNGIYMGTVQLGNHNLIATSFFNPGAASIGTLELLGSGNVLDAMSQLTFNALNINGGTLNNSNWSGLVERAYTTSDITLGSLGGTVNLGLGEDRALSRKLTGTGSLTKTGMGVLTLRGSNDYSGGTTVNGGNLKGGFQIGYFCAVKIGFVPNLLFHG